MAAIVMILLALVAVFYSTAVFSQDIVKCNRKYPKDCDCLNKLKRVMTECGHPGCSDDACGDYTITLNFFLDCGCLLPGGRCLAICSRDNHLLRSSWQNCSLDTTCAQDCVVAYQYRYKYEIEKCRGKTLCLKQVNSHINGPFNCGGKLSAAVMEKYNDDELCPC